MSQSFTCRITQHFIIGLYVWILPTIKIKPTYTVQKAPSNVKYYPRADNLIHALHVMHVTNIMSAFESIKRHPPFKSCSLLFWFQSALSSPTKSCTAVDSACLLWIGIRSQLWICLGVHLLPVTCSRWSPCTTWQLPPHHLTNSKWLHSHS